MELDEDDGTTRRNESYLALLGDHLLVHDVPARRVGEHVADVAGHLAATGADPWREFGQPEEYAAALLAADGRPARRVGVRAVAMAGTVLLGGLGLSLVLAGPGPVAVRLSTLPTLLVLASLAGACSATPWSTGLRDALGRDNPRPRRPWRILALVAGAGLLGAVAEEIGASALGARTLGWPGVPSWLAGVVLLAGGIPPLLVAVRLPRFPAGSALHASRWRRRVRVSPRPGVR